MEQRTAVRSSLHSRFAALMETVAKHPSTILISLALTVLGLIVAVYFAIFPSLPKPAIEYYVHTDRAQIVQQGVASSLTFSINGVPVTQNVTAVQIAVWNDGKAPVTAADVLSPFVIRTDPATTIFEATDLKVSREEIGLQMDKSLLSKGRLGLSWRILEQGDRAIVQLIYAGSPDVAILADGSFEGQKHVRQGTGSNYKFQLETQILTTLLFTTAVMGYAIFRRMPISGPGSGWTWLMLSALAVCVLGSIFATWFVHPPVQFD